MFCFLSQLFVPHNLDTEESILKAVKTVKRPNHDSMMKMFNPQSVVHSANVETSDSEKKSKSSEPVIQAASLELRNTDESSDSEEKKIELMETTIEDLKVLNWLVLAILVIGITGFMVYYVKLRKRKLNDDDYVPISQ